MTDLSDKLVAERRARLAAERLLELKSRELFAANRKLSDHALSLSREIVVHRRSAESAVSEAEELRGEVTRVQSDLQKATYSLNLAEHRLWLALETMRDGFAIYDMNWKLVIANSAYMAVFDGLEEIGPGVHYRDILRIGLEEGVFDPGEETPGQFVDSMQARWRPNVIEPRVIRLWNGHYIRLVDRRGMDGGVVSLALDITETIRNETRLREARRKAETASRAKSAFLANMSHELRTPMNGVVGMAELLAESATNDEQRLYAETIRSSGEALLLIINDVLDYSKLEAERMKLHPEPFDLERLVHEVAMVLTPGASKKGVLLEVDYDLFLPGTLTGDRGRIRQILTNLVGNAVKFTEAGHVLIRVTGIGTAEGRQRVHIAVEDTGIGIPSEMRDHIFGEFNQVDDAQSRRFEGTGLGLAITRQLVRLMGGEVWVSSEPGRGSCFTVAVELAVADATQLTLPDLPGVSRILLLESDRLGRRILERQLGAMGFEVVAANGPAEAQWERADIIFADTRAAAAPTFPPPGSTAAPVVVIAAVTGGPPAVPAGIARVATLPRPFLRAELLAALEAAGRAVAVGNAAEVPQAEDQAPAPRRLTVLAAEDNRTNQLVFSKMVKDLALDLGFAANGREAVEAFGRTRPDLIFMDISMPEMDGKEATRRIRAIEAREGLEHTPIVALTAHALMGDDTEILSAGLDRYLTKPLKKAAILDVIEELFPGFLAQGSAAPASGTTG